MKIAKEGKKSLDPNSYYFNSPRACYCSHGVDQMRVMTPMCSCQCDYGYDNEVANFDKGYKLY